MKKKIKNYKKKKKTYFYVQLKTQIQALAERKICIKYLFRAKN